MGWVTTHHRPQGLRAVGTEFTPAFRALPVLSRRSSTCPFLLETALQEPACLRHDAPWRKARARELEPHHTLCWNLLSSVRQTSAHRSAGHPCHMPRLLLNDSGTRSCPAECKTSHVTVGRAVESCYGEGTDDWGPWHKSLPCVQSSVVFTRTHWSASDIMTYW